MSGLAALKIYRLALNNGHHSFIEHLLCARHGQVLPLREKLAPTGTRTHAGREGWWEPAVLVTTSEIRNLSFDKPLYDSKRTHEPPARWPVTPGRAEEMRQQDVFEVWGSTETHRECGEFCRDWCLWACFQAERRDGAGWIPPGFWNIAEPRGRRHGVWLRSVSFRLGAVPKRPTWGQG